MLYLQFNGYEGFKEIFGINEHGNGEKSRKNKILLALFKHRPFWQMLKDEGLRGAMRTARELRTMSDMRILCLALARHFAWRDEGDVNVISVGDENTYCFSSPDYRVDNEGLCLDGDTRAVRYINLQTSREYKMKAGKFLTHLIEGSTLGKVLPIQVKTWLAEDFADRWRAYAERKLGTGELHLGTDIDDFRRIYSKQNYAGDFGSCMAHGNGDHASFYTDAVKAKAAWLENDAGCIVARCVVFTDVYDEEGEKYRLAERQYSADGSNVLMRLLVDKLIEAGEIDGYKQIGAGCSDARAWVANDGTSWSTKDFSIKCNLESDDTLSYQDSFKWYDEDNHTAYNYPEDGAEGDLSTTDLYYEGCHANQVWSEYHDEYINEDDAVYCEDRQDYFYDYEVHYCVNTRTNEYEDDCVQLANDDWAFYGHNCEGYDGVYVCDCCGEYFLEDDMSYEDYTDQFLCGGCFYDEKQRYMKEHADEEGFRYDVVDREWYDPKLNEQDDVRVLAWDWDAHRRYNTHTRRRNINRWSGPYTYKNNYYYDNCYCAEDGNKYPAEKREVVERTLAEKELTVA